MHLISEEEYLHTSFRPDCDFVDGTAVERQSGQFDHSRLQLLLATLVGNNEAKWGIIGLVEQRLRVRPGKYRIPDLLALPLDYDRSNKIVTIAPLLCIEILSPDDTMPRILERCWEYHEMGVPETWIFDPEEKRIFVAKNLAVTEFKGDLLSSGKIEISSSELFSKL